MTLRDLIADTEPQLAEILAATPTRSAIDGIRRPQPGSRPPCDLDRIDQITAELDQLRYWSRRWGSPRGNVADRISYLLDVLDGQSDDERRRLLAHWGPVRRASESRWPINTPAEVEWWTLQEAAAKLDRSERVLQRWARKNPSMTKLKDGRLMFAVPRLKAIDDGTVRRARPA